MTWTPVSTCGDTLNTNRTCCTIAFASPSVRDFVPRAPVRRPLTLRPPASIQIMLSPMLRICSWTWLDAPSPTATLQITAPTPMMMPSMVRTLRILLRAKARTATRSISPKLSTRPSGLARPYQALGRVDFITEERPACRSNPHFNLVNRGPGYAGGSSADKEGHQGGACPPPWQLLELRHPSG